MSQKFTIVFLMLFSLDLNAQATGNVYYISLKGMLIYVLPFYGITIIALGLFIQKILRPSFSLKWLYICTITGILGAGLIAYKFKEIRMTQLPEAQPKNIKMNGISKEIQDRIREREKSDLKETVANYWIIAIPNFILVGLGLGLDWMNKKNS
ncbi:hypothetical protein OAK19_00010 [Aureispira]|nr:hypothetical protein [Aureispira sp.]